MWDSCWSEMKMFIKVMMEGGRLYGWIYLFNSGKVVWVDCGVFFGLWSGCLFWVWFLLYVCWVWLVMLVDCKRVDEVGNWKRRLCGYMGI